MPINLQAGQLRHRIRFERLGVQVSDSSGNQVSPWGELCVRSAKVKPIPVTTRAAEVIIQGRLQGTNFVTVQVRYDSITKTLTTDDRAVDVNDGTVYNVRSALDLDGDRRWMTLDCQKGVAT